MATNPIPRYQTALNIRTCTVVVGNSNQISHVAGQAFAIELPNEYYMVFMTLGFNFSAARTPSNAVFWLELDSERLYIKEPYSLMCWNSSNYTMFPSAYSSDNSSIILFPFTSNANTRSNITGVALFAKAS